MKCENSRSTDLDHSDCINHRDTENIKQEINTASRTDRQKKAIIKKNARKKWGGFSFGQPVKMQTIQHWRHVCSFLHDCCTAIANCTEVTMPRGIGRYHGVTTKTGVFLNVRPRKLNRYLANIMEETTASIVRLKETDADISRRRSGVTLRLANPLLIKCLTKDYPFNTHC